MSTKTPTKAATKPARLKNPPAPVAPKRTPRRAAPVKTSRAKSVPAVERVRVVTESDLAGGRLWKMSGRNGVAYVRDAALASELLQTEPRNLARAAMAVYYDKKGRAFAWQVRFDADRWEEVTRRLG